MTRDEADAMLRKAIDDHARAWGIAEDDELLSTWVVVAHWQKVEANGHSNYTTQYDGNEMPTHVVSGLLHVGLDHLYHQAHEDDD